MNMKRKNLFTAGVFCVLLIFALSTLGCENLFDDLFGGKDSNSGGYTNGTITITGVPPGYVLSGGEVSTFAKPEWVIQTVGYGVPYTNSMYNNVEWQSAFIGSINRQPGNPAGTGRIESATRTYTGSGWTLKWNQQSFTYSGTCGIYLSFSTRPGSLNEPYNFGLSNVYMDNGKVTLSWSDLLASYETGTGPIVDQP